MLRDDVVTCLEKLKTGYHKKTELLNQLSLSETESLANVTIGNVGGLQESLKKSDDIILQIQSLDFDIAALYDELSVILGVKKNLIVSTIAQVDKKNAELVLDLMRDCEELMQKVYGKNEELIAKMENSMDGIEEDISQLISTRKAMEIIGR